jgi:hypothetical protein
MRSGKIALDKIYKRRDRYEIPDWQRDKVWGPEKQRKLLDTILRGWKLPKFYFLKTGAGPDTFDVVDGQQRLSAIWRFLDGDIQLSPDTTNDFGSESYKGLSDANSDAFDDYEIEYDVITDATDEEVKDFFQRLQAGLPLTTSEKLNSVHSKLRDYCAKLSEHPFFANSSTVADRRHGYFDICSKVATLEIEGMDSGLRFEDVKEVFLANANFSSSSAAAKRIRSSFDLLHALFPERSRALRQRSMVQSVISLVCHLKRAGMTDAQAQLLKSFIEEFSTELLTQVEAGQEATDLDFIAFQRTVNANVKSGAQQRHTILLRKLFARHPEFFSSMSKSKELEGSIASDIDSQAREIQRLIHSINEVYATTHGEDLFKATNKTVPALATLDRSITSVDNYRAWIDDLYFLFWESTGTRLDGAVPTSFADVNSLRTSTQHDVDHGKKVTAKRKKLGSDFAKYAGAPTPDTLAPEEFALMQANVLGALVVDLRTLSKAQP